MAGDSGRRRGKHNRSYKRIVKSVRPEFINPSKRCNVCEEVKPLDDFAKMSKAPDGRQYTCRECSNRRTKENLATKRKLIAEYKVLVGCADCGFNSWPEALDFDHLTNNKAASPSDMLGCGWSRIVAEIEKCEVVCANCHRHRTWLRGGGDVSE